MDRDSPCPFRVRTHTKLLVHIPFLSLAAFSSLLFQFRYPLLHVFQILLEGLDDC